MGALPFTYERTSAAAEQKVGQMSGAASGAPRPAGTVADQLTAGMSCRARQQPGPANRGGSTARDHDKQLHVERAEGRRHTGRYTAGGGAEVSIDTVSAVQAGAGASDELLVGVQHAGDVTRDHTDQFGAHGGGRKRRQSCCTPRRRAAPARRVWSPCAKTARSPRAELRHAGPGCGALLEYRISGP